MKTRKPFSMFLALSTAVVTFGMQPTGAATGPSSPTLGSLPLSLDKLLPDVLGVPVDLSGALEPPTDGIRVALVSSGVDTSVLPSSLRTRVSRMGNGSDAVGWGTYSASVIFQLAPNARITSLGVFNNGKLDAQWHQDALTWVGAHASDFDVVLHAVPPNDFLDPVSAFMSTNRWLPLWDAMSNNPTTDGRRKMFAVAMDPAMRAAQVARATAADRKLIEDFAILTDRWNAARAAIKKINEAGISFVAPTGDLGPRLQSILGVGNLPEVITVGGWDGNSPSTSGSVGPSIDGSVKPDLLASTGIVGLLPASSKITETLNQQGLIDPSLSPDWGAGEPSTSARARLDTSFTSAALASVGTATIASQGIRDAAKQRGALTAAAVPAAGVPAWVQGAGVLKMIPDAAFAGSRTLALSSASLGVQPASGDWVSTVPTSGVALSATSSLYDFAGVSPAGNITRSVGATSSPGLGASVGNDGVKVTAPLGNYSHEAGLYCGYSAVGIPTTGSTIEAKASAEGIPAGTEQVPTCLVTGTKLDAFNFYIHDMPAEDLTFALIPALPEEVAFLEQPLTMIPVDAGHPKLFMKVSGADGYTRFPNVPPGHYRLRQWSDYASPKQQVVKDRYGNPVTLASELGGNGGYLDYYGLILSQTGWTYQDLQNTFGASNVSQDPPSGGYWVQIGPRKTRVLIGYTKKMPGPGITGRYIDLLAEADYTYLAREVVDKLYLIDLEEATDDLRGWAFSQGPQQPDQLNAVFNPAATAGDAQRTMGIAQYPFAMTQPNFITHMSLNFSYKIDNGIVAVIMQTGDEAAVGAVLPNGSIYMPSVGPEDPIELGTLDSPVSRSSGTANFEFTLKSKGVATGMLTFLFLPSRPVSELATPLSTMQLWDMSFELETWTNGLWPAASHDSGQGHIFSFDSNYAPDQMDHPGCRILDNGNYNSQVCEDWQVFVHSPGDDAGIADVLIPAQANDFFCRTGTSIVPELAAAGGAFFDPRRGVSDFTAAISTGAPSSVDLTTGAIGIDLDASRIMHTNGRFWEQLSIPRAVLRAHPGIITMHLVDNVSGRQTSILPHRPGNVEVAPYIPFVSKANTVAL